jgi:hypothetical protein
MQNTGNAIKPIALSLQRVMMACILSLEVNVGRISEA